MKQDMIHNISQGDYTHIVPGELLLYALLHRIEHLEALREEVLNAIEALLEGFLLKNTPEKELTMPTVTLLLCKVLTPDDVGVGAAVRALICDFHKHTADLSNKNAMALSLEKSGQYGLSRAQWLDLRISEMKESRKE